MENRSKLGMTDLNGPAVDRFSGLKDDNHSYPAEEEAALRNFDSFARSFFDTQRSFIRECGQDVRKP
jgi:hypothetical protein